MTFIFGIYALTQVWPSGWSWHMGAHTPHYLQMILGIYATLGIFLLIASRNPLANLSLIWFTVWSSVVHAAIMGAQSLANPEHIGHLWGDVLALFSRSRCPCVSDATKRCEGTLVCGHGPIAGAFLQANNSTVQGWCGRVLVKVHHALM